MSYINRSIILLIALANFAFAYAQNVFHGDIVSMNGKVGIANGYVLLIQDGKILRQPLLTRKGIFP